MYNGFAEVYDRLMDNVQYDDWADYYTRLLYQHGVAEGSKVCECACGTGSLTIPLQKRGFQMTGADLSQEMLWIAAQKARAEGLGIPFVRQDMRRLRLHRPMDAVLATCDGVNYLMDDRDLLAFFAAARQALRPGGVLAFDVSTPEKLQNVLGDRLICEDREDITYFWQNRWHEKTATVDMTLCFFVKQPDGSYKRIDESQKQKAHDRVHLAALLYQSGFDHVSVWGNGTMTAPREGEHRWHITAVRPAEAE